MALLEGFSYERTVALGKSVKYSPGFPVSSSTTYYYVTSAGSFGSTTDPASVPATAGVYRRSTS